MQIHATQALLGIGEVIHQRLSPVRHGFRYGVFFLMLPMRTALPLKSHWWLGINRVGLLSFRDADHGDTHRHGLDWLDALLKQEDISDADGPVWLQCFPRVLGYAFKPVSFWFCHRLDGALRCVVVEVNNTFGERHVYLLDESRPLTWGEGLSAKKHFHVSPFCTLSGLYRFRFMRAQATPVEPLVPLAPLERLVVRIDYDAPHAQHLPAAPLLQTSVSGQLAPATATRVLFAFMRYPLMTLAVIARIHWHALRLWLKRVPFVSKPPAPKSFVTMSD
jgi:uncharacterized protein